MKKMTIDYKKPIFVCYIDVTNISQQKAEEFINGMMDIYDVQYTNVQMWYIPSNESKIECIYPGMLDTEFTEKMRVILDDFLDLGGVMQVGGSESGMIIELKKKLKDLILEKILQ